MQTRPDQAIRQHQLIFRLDAESVNGLAADYDAGMSVAGLQEKYELSKASVRKLLREADVVMRRQSLTADQLRLATLRYQDGLTIRQVAAELGLSKTTVQNTLRMAGLQMRPSGRRRKP